MPVELADLEGLLGNADSAGVDRFDSVAEFVLRRFERSGWELSVCFVGDEEMRRLNSEWRDKDRSTDVLSFAQDESCDETFSIPQTPEESTAPAPALGDVVISVPRACEQARDGGWSVDEEVTRLLLHGILHFLGYDHEGEAEEALRMRKVENETAAALIEAGMACASESS